jgi:hypothetical protein
MHAEDDTGDEGPGPGERALAEPRRAPARSPTGAVEEKAARLKDDRER